MTDSTSGTRTPPPPPPKRPPPPPPPPKKAASLSASTSQPSSPSSPATTTTNKSRTTIIAGVAVLLLAAAGTGAWFYIDYAKKAEEVRVAQEKVKQEEDLKKQEAEKVAKAAAALREQVAAVLTQSKIPLDRAAPHLQLMLDGSAANNEPAIVSAQHEIEALPKPDKGDNVLATKLANEAIPLTMKGDGVGAVSLFLKAVAADQSDATLLVGLADALGLAGDMEDARTSARLALALDPSRPYAWQMYGKLNAIEGKKEASAASFLNFVRFSNDRNDAKTNLEALAKNDQAHPAVRESAKAVLNSSALMLVTSSAPLATGKPDNAEPPSPPQTSSNAGSTPPPQTSGSTALKNDLRSNVSPKASGNAGPTTSAQRSYRIPGKIIGAIPIRAGNTTPCQQSDLEHVEHTGRSGTRTDTYCITAEDNTHQVRHTWASDYPYQPGTTLYMRVFEDNHIVIE